MTELICHTLPIRRCGISQFAKMAIIDSFIKHISERPFDKITVKDFVVNCGINRNTFYYYFEDIYNLVDQLFRLETQKIMGDESDYTTVKKGTADLDPDQSDLELIADFYTHALTGMLLEWLNSGMKSDPKKLISRLGVLFDENIRYCFEKKNHVLNRENGWFLKRNQNILQGGYFQKAALFFVTVG